MIDTQAAVLTAFTKPLELTDIRVDEPEPHEVRLAVTNVGLCHSDLHYMTGTVPTDLPAVLGHEVAGVVEAVGSAVTGLRLGDRVVYDAAQDPDAQHLPNARGAKPRSSPDTAVRHPGQNAVRTTGGGLIG
jgi:S-(hydroxymethyl)glutathione dehydrogenase / alcohol dehydrogenase